MENTPPPADVPAAAPAPADAPAAAPAQKTRVVFCLPGRTFSNRFLLSWTQTVVEMANSGKYSFMISQNYSSFVSFARALCLGYDVTRGSKQKPFNSEIPYDVIVWIDSDIVYNYQLVDRLITLCMEKSPVVSGIYAMEGGQAFCAVQKWDQEYYLKNGSFEFLSADAANAYIKETGSNLMPCVYAGMGFMAIRQGVLEDERLAYPPFHRPLERIPTGREDVAEYVDSTSEDVALMRNLEDAGIIDHVLVDLSLRVGHEKMVVL